MEFPTGTFRSASCGTTISNYAGVTQTVQGGAGPVRVFGVYLKVVTTGTNASVTLSNGLAGTNTSTNFLNVRCLSTFENNFDTHSGILFPSGCFISTNGAIDYVAINFRNETI